MIVENAGKAQQQQLNYVEDYLHHRRLFIICDERAGAFGGRITPWLSSCWHTSLDLQPVGRNGHDRKRRIDTATTDHIVQSMRMVASWYKVGCDIGAMIGDLERYSRDIRRTWYGNTAVL